MHELANGDNASPEDFSAETKERAIRVHMWHIGRLKESARKLPLSNTEGIERYYVGIGDHQRTIQIIHRDLEFVDDF